jgi:hypothetical protein
VKTAWQVKIAAIVLTPERDASYMIADALIVRELFYFTPSTTPAGLGDLLVRQCLLDGYHVQVESCREVRRVAPQPSYLEVILVEAQPVYSEQDSYISNRLDAHQKGVTMR